MTEFESNNSNIKDFVTNPTLKEKNYCFFKIEEWMSSSTINPYYKRNLEASSQRVFRTMKLNPFFEIVTMLMFISIFIILVSILGSIFSDWTNDYITKGNLLVVVLFTILLFVLRKKLSNGLNRNPTIRFLLSVIPAILISITGFICIGTYLIIFDRLFLHLGSLKILDKMQKN